ncbi:hypothetical protein P691DRAFT_658323 [Macrolepiota fuliginosa MF-IS2]|uniref:Ataxin-10 homolog n=1 Tax=Macrolepiota fuliginosa MF-IS2 TaxID=1400762 RepID=A0A9P5XNE1_9AGAR|nr:hypothetical protein P691DRAFT_658323 [Macrolepiota fuliginosa MF-IS2]
MAEATDLLGTKFITACSQFDIKSTGSITSLARTLDKLSPELAKRSQTRVTLGSDMAIWPSLRKLWKDLARAHSTFWDADDSDDEADDGKTSKQEALTSLCAALAKFTRNLVAGVPDSQFMAFTNEPEIRRLLHYYTSWSAMEDEKSIIVARLLTQALSNLVTGHEELMDRLWETNLNLPEDQVVIIRLLGSPDAKTLLSTLIFISNCLHESRKRTKLLCKASVGVRVCVCLLDNMLRLFEAEDGTEGARAFDIGYTILSRIIEEGLAAPLYKQFILHVSVPTFCYEIITPHQTTLLKIIDSYLQSNQSTPQTPIKPETLQIHISLTPMLTRAFFSLSRYAQNSIRHSLGLGIKKDNDTNSNQSGHRRGRSDSSVSSTSSSTNNMGSSNTQTQSTGPLRSLDVMLPKVCEALVLVTQCMVTIAIEAEENAVQMDIQEDASPRTNMKNYFNEARMSGVGVVESLIELLRLLDIFLPRINFGRPVHPTNVSGPNIPQGQADTATADNQGFAYLKRDLVRMLGILCHKTRAVQDRVREVGGIEVVMNMCVIDDRNPYLREHAIFTLHNLLNNNPENQHVVDSIQPSGEWDGEGVLRDRPGATRK